MKILLTAINSKFIHSNLAVRYLKSFTNDLPYEGKYENLLLTIGKKEY